MNEANIASMRDSSAQMRKVIDGTAEEALQYRLDCLLEFLKLPTQAPIFERTAEHIVSLVFDADKLAEVLGAIVEKFVASEDKFNIVNDVFAKVFAAKLQAIGLTSIYAAQAGSKSINPQAEAYISATPSIEDDSPDVTILHKDSKLVSDNQFTTSRAATPEPASSMVNETFRPAMRHVRPNTFGFRSFDTGKSVHDWGWKTVLIKALPINTSSMDATTAIDRLGGKLLVFDNKTGDTLASFPAVRAGDMAASGRVVIADNLYEAKFFHGNVPPSGYNCVKTPPMVWASPSASPAKNKQIVSNNNEGDQFEMKDLAASAEIKEVESVAGFGIVDGPIFTEKITSPIIQVEAVASFGMVEGSVVNEENVAPVIKKDEEKQTNVVDMLTFPEWRARKFVPTKNYGGPPASTINAIAAEKTHPAEIIKSWGISGTTSAPPNDSPHSLISGPDLGPRKHVFAVYGTHPWNDAAFARGMVLNFGVKAAAVFRAHHGKYNENLGFDHRETYYAVFRDNSSTPAPVEQDMMVCATGGENGEGFKAKLKPIKEIPREATLIVEADLLGSDELNFLD